MTVVLITAPFSKDFITLFVQAVREIFGDEAKPDWLNSLKWRLENMPDVTVFGVMSDSRLIGFKAGYASAQNRYYSWLGGVVPDFRHQGLASELMIAQHEWLEASSFTSIETHVATNNKAMMDLNLKYGYLSIGSFLKDEQHTTIMIKKSDAFPAADIKSKDSK